VDLRLPPGSEPWISIALPLDLNGAITIKSKRYDRLSG
jgi:hypothetical protein